MEALFSSKRARGIGSQKGISPPKGELEHIHYFCGNVEIPTDLKEREPQRSALYKGTASLVRAYASIADELEHAGYSSKDIARIQQLQTHYLNLRELIKQASGESLDVKAYEADMRHLIDTYVQADEPRKISPFDNLGLLELIVKTGIADAIAQKLSSLKNNTRAIAETIENKVSRFFVQRMKTRWGSCNPLTASIRVNTDLAKRPPQCLEYIVVHEMTHLLEPTHNARFIALMDRFMPQWEQHRQLLNRLPVRHEDWDY